MAAHEGRYITSTLVLALSHPITGSLDDTRVGVAIDQAEDEADSLFAGLGLIIPIPDPENVLNYDQLQAGCEALVLARLMRDHHVALEVWRSKQSEGIKTLKRWAKALIQEKQRDAGAFIVGRAYIHGHRVDGDEIGNEETDRLEYP